MAWLNTPVNALAPLGADATDIKVIAMSEGRAPSGWGRLVSRFADEANVRADVVVALAMHETGLFKYGGTDSFSADPSFHNFGGLKTTDGTATHRFATDALGVMGLVAHIAWYAHPDHVASFCDKAHDPRHFSGPIWEPWQHKGTLHVVGDLGSGIWNGRAGVPDGYAIKVTMFLDQFWRV